MAATLGCETHLGRYASCEFFFIYNYYICFNFVFY